ncbi:MAG TPA: phosphate ABC transporter substrate-binding protein PstS [Candidatus Dormibacteraeota bacterium]|jgi:phosphate transport system substrate-binding protein
MFRLSTIGRIAVMAVAAGMVATACGGSTGETNADVGKGSLTGAGATFPGPFYQKAFANYSIKYPQVTINYQSVGSGAGIQQFIKKTVDFGASDVPMSGSDIQAAGGAGTLTQIPTTLGVISIAFNISGVNSLKLDADTLAAIYLGKIKKWNDPMITALNSGTNLPDKAITVVHRSDGSGTTFHFTDYMSKISVEWKNRVGNAKSVPWPTGVGASGNQAVAQAVSSTDGAIGYVELAYVVQTGMKQAALKNANGKFVQASVEGATAAAGTKPDVTPSNFSITNAACDACYPIAGFSWAMLYTSYSDADKGKAVVNLFKWLVTDGQNDGKDLQYAPLPSAVQQLALTNLKSIKAGGSAVLS